jgi:hypothetical protein
MRLSLYVSFSRAFPFGKSTLQGKPRFFVDRSASSTPSFAIVDNIFLTASSFDALSTSVSIKKIDFDAADRPVAASLPAHQLVQAFAHVVIAMQKKEGTSSCSG